MTNNNQSAAGSVVCTARNNAAVVTIGFLYNIEPELLPCKRINIYTAPCCATYMLWIVRHLSERFISQIRGKYESKSAEISSFTSDLDLIKGPSS